MKPLLLLICALPVPAVSAGPVAHWNARSGDSRHPFEARNWNTRPDAATPEPPPEDFLSREGIMGMDLYISETAITLDKWIRPMGHVLTLGFAGTLRIEGGGFGKKETPKGTLRIDGGHLAATFVANTHIEILGPGSLTLSGGGMPLNGITLEAGPHAAAKLMFSHKDRSWLREQLALMTRDGRPLREDVDFRFLELDQGSGLRFLPVSLP